MKISINSTIVVLVAKVLMIFWLLHFGNTSKATEPIKGQFELGVVSDSATLFGEGIISTHLAERDAALSPSGKEFYYTVSSYNRQTIVFSELTDKGWTKPQVAPFSGIYSDLEPHFSPDGHRLYFVSNRPLGSEGEPKDYDIWYVERKCNSWGDPINLGSPINTSANEFYPSITNSGTIYWCSVRNDSLSVGGEDIFFSKLEDGVYSKVEALSDSVNTIRDEYNAFVARDESYIIFTSLGWGRGYGRGDLWICFKRSDGLWTKPVNMGGKINSEWFEFCPFVSDCGKFLFFTSDRIDSKKLKPTITYNDIVEFSLSSTNKQNNIYIISTSIIDDLKQSALELERD